MRHVDFAVRVVLPNGAEVPADVQPFTPAPGLKFDLSVGGFTVASLIQRHDGSFRVIDHKVGPVCNLEVPK